MPNSPITRDPSCCSRGKQVERPTARHYTHRENLKHTILTGKFPLNFFIRGSGNSMRSGGKNVRRRGVENIRKTRPSKPTEQSLHELTETEPECTGPAQVWTGSCALCTCIMASRSGMIWNS